MGLRRLSSDEADASHLDDRPFHIEHYIVVLTTGWRRYHAGVVAYSGSIVVLVSAEGWLRVRGDPDCYWIDLDGACRSLVA